MKKSKKTLVILALSIITLAFFAACSNPAFPKLKDKSTDRDAGKNIAVTITADFEADGSTVTITADVTDSDGGTLAYQWYKNTIDSNEEGTELSGETAAKYQPPVDTIGTTYYYVTVTNTIKGQIAASVTSNTIGIIVHENNRVEIIVSGAVEAPVVTIAASSDGAKVTLTATVTGSGGGTLAYQWYSNAVDRNDGGTALPGATDSNYEPPVDAVGTTYYYVKIANALEEKIFNAVSNTIGILVNANGVIEVLVSEAETPVVTIAAFNDGVKVTLTAAAAVSDGGTLTYQWYRSTTDRSDGGTALYGETTTTYTPPVSSNSTAYYYVKATNALNGQTASATSHTVRITIQDGKITEVVTSETVETPVVSVTAFSTSWNVTLTASATVSDGGTISYRWYKNTVDDSKGGTFITGATGTSYTPTVSGDETAYYYVKATNTLKGQTVSASSNTVRIVVESGGITEVVTSKTVETPQVNVTAESVGASVTLTATATVSDGGTLSYQWYRNTIDNSKSGSLISGATGTKYTPSTDAIGSTAYYYVKVTNNLRGQIADTSSNTVRVIVLSGGITEVVVSETVETPVVIVTAVANNRNVILTATASIRDGGILSYQWYRNTVDNRNGILIAGATGTTYIAPTATPGTTYYYVKVTNNLRGQTAGGISNVVGVIVPIEGGAVDIIEVDTPDVETPSITIAADVNGRNVTLTATASVSDGGTINYQWYHNTQNNKNGTAIANATGPTYTPPTSVIGTIYYFCSAINNLNGQTAGAVSNIVGVVVPEETGVIEIVVVDTPLVNIIASPAPGPYSMGSTIVITASASVSDGGALSYQWYSNTVDRYTGTAIQDATGILYTPQTGVIGTTYYYCVATNTLSGETASAASNIAEITVTKTQISSAAVVVTAPVRDQPPNAQALSNDTGYTSGNVAWKNSDGTAHTGNFVASTVYAATVTLTASADYIFAANNFTATINGEPATVSEKSDTSVTLSLVFDATSDRVVQNLSITTPPTKMTYTYGETIDLTGLEISITYNSGEPDSGTFADLSARFGTNISTSPALGQRLYVEGTTGTAFSVTAFGVTTPTTTYLTVNKKELTVTGVSHTKVYDKTTAAEGITVTSLGGIVFNDSGISLVGASGTYSSANAGTTTLSAVDGGALTGTQAGNYQITHPATVDITVTGGGITKADPVVTAWPTVERDATLTYISNTITSIPVNGGTADGATANMRGDFRLTADSSQIRLKVGLHSYPMRFIPTDTANYNEVTGTGQVRGKLVHTMISVPAGSFEMGQNGPGSTGNVTPVHTVTLDAFRIGQTEVTEPTYERVITDMGFPSEALLSGNRPLVSRSWYRAIRFCNILSIGEGYTPAYSINGETDPSKWPAIPTASNSTTLAAWNAVTIVAGSTGYRLPTEAQWEYAAKGGNGSPGNYVYAGSNTIGDVAWYASNSGTNGGASNPDLHGVGLGKASTTGTTGTTGTTAGIYDMSGNASEWCWDWYATPYASGAATNPTGPTSGTNRVVRGGSFNQTETYCRNVTRENYAPYSTSANRGFRVVRPQ